MRGRWAVVKNVAQMSVAPGALHLISLHPVRIVLLYLDVFFGDGLIEAGPSRAGFEFRFGIEKDRVAADAVVQPIRVVVGVFAGAGDLSTGLAGPLELFRR